MYIRVSEVEVLSVRPRYCLWASVVLMDRGKGQGVNGLVLLYMEDNEGKTWRSDAHSVRHASLPVNIKGVLVGCQHSPSSFHNESSLTVALKVA